MQLYGSKDLGFRHWLPTNSSWLWTIESSGSNRDLDFSDDVFDLKSDADDGVSLAAMPLIVTVGVLVFLFAALGVFAVGQKVVLLVRGSPGQAGAGCRCHQAENDRLVKSSDEDPINTV